MGRAFDGRHSAGAAKKCRSIVLVQVVQVSTMQLDRQGVDGGDRGGDQRGGILIVR